MVVLDVKTNVAQLVAEVAGVRAREDVRAVTVADQDVKEPVKDVRKDADKIVKDVVLGPVMEVVYLLAMGVVKVVAEVARVLVTIHVINHAQVVVQKYVKVVLDVQDVEMVVKELVL